MSEWNCVDREAARSERDRLSRAAVTGPRAEVEKRSTDAIAQRDATRAVCHKSATHVVGNIEPAVDNVSAAVTARRAVGQDAIDYSCRAAWTIDSSPDTSRAVA